MQYQHPRRFIVFAAVVLASALSTACDSAAVAGPVSSPRHTALKAVHDDDPATCANGYTISEGHTYCNPI